MTSPVIPLFPDRDTFPGRTRYPGHVTEAAYTLFPGLQTFPGRNTFPGRSQAAQALEVEAVLGGVSITVYNRDYQPLGRVGDYIKASVTWELLAPGGGEIEVPADHWLVTTALDINRTVVPVIITVNGVPWTGRIATVTRDHSGNDAVGTATIGLISDWAWLQSILAWTEPTKVARAQGLDVPVTGQLATIACQMINDNVARLGVPVVAIAPIQDTSAITTIVPALAPLADYLTPAFQAQGWSLTVSAWLPGDPQPVGYVPVTGNLFKQVPILSEPTILVRTAPNTPKPWVRWSDSVGGVIADSVLVEDPKAYRSLLGGSGQADTRIYAEYTDTGLRDSLGRFGFPETFGSVQTENGKDSVADVLAGGPTQQLANAGKVNISVTVQDGTPWLFGRDYIVGDIPTVELVGIALGDKPITTVVASDDADTGLVLTPTIGDSKATSTSDAMIVDAIQRIAAQLRQLQTGK